MSPFSLRLFAIVRPVFAGWIVFAWLLFPQFLSASDKTWTGAANTKWGTNGNWTGGAPSAGDNAVFNSTFSNQPNLTANATAGGIWMTGSIGQNVTISDSGFTLTLNGNTINGTAGLGILVDNANAFTLTISASLQVGNAQTWRNSSANLLTISGAVNTNAKALTIDGSGSTTISGVLSSTGAITKAGTGTLTLSNTGDTYSGQLTVQAGTLKIDTINNASANGELGNNALSVILGSSGATGMLEYTGATASSTKTFTMAASGTGAFQIDTAGTSLTLSGVINGTGALSKTGSGTLILTGANTYSGGTNINAGTLNVGSSGALGSSGTISFGGGTLQYSASNTTDYSNRFSTASNQLYSIDTNGQTITFATALTSSGGSLTKLGSGTLILSAANTYTAGTTLSAGTLQLSGSGTLGSTSGSLTVNGGTLDLNGTNQTVGALNGSGGTILNNSTGTAKTLTVGNGGASGSYSGVIADHTSGTGTLALTKTGSGTETLSGVNTYTGATTINAGTLSVSSLANGGSNSNLGASTNVATNLILNGGTLTYTGAAVSTDRLFSVGTSGGTVDASGSGAVNFTNTGSMGFNSQTGTRTLTLTGTNTGSNTLAAIVGDNTGATSLVKNGAGTWVLTGTNTYTGATTINAGILNIQNASALGTTAAGTTISSGGTLQLQGGISVGAEALTISGVGAAGQNGALVNVSGTNNYGGLLSLGAATTISSDSGTLNLTNTGTITGATFGLTLTGAGTGNISSIIGITTGPVTKSGSGTWTLSGVNTYTGATTVNAGTLNVNGSLASGSAVTVNNSGSVLGGIGTIFGSVSVASSGAILQAGTGSTGQTLTMRGALTMGSGSIIQLALGASAAHSTLAIGTGGSISFQSLQKFNITDLGVTGGSTYNGLITGVGADPGTESGWTIANQPWASVFSYDPANGGEIDLNITAVPEPSSYVVGILALVGFGYLEQRRIRKFLTMFAGRPATL